MAETWTNVRIERRENQKVGVVSATYTDDSFSPPFTHTVRVAVEASASALNAFAARATAEAREQRDRLKWGDQRKDTVQAALDAALQA